MTQPTEHMTNAGEPDMRFKENKESYGNETDTSNSNTQQNEDGSQHLTKEGEPDMRFKENQQGGDGSQIGDKRDGSQQQSEHLTNAGEPDMRFKENKETYGES